MKKGLREMFEDEEGLISSKRVAGIFCCGFGLVAHMTLMIAEVFFGFNVSRLAYESADSMFWAAFAFLGVNALTQGVQAWRSKK